MASASVVWWPLASNSFVGSFVGRSNDQQRGYQPCRFQTCRSATPSRARKLSNFRTAAGSSFGFSRTARSIGDWLIVSTASRRSSPSASIPRLGSRKLARRARTPSVCWLKAGTPRLPRRSRRRRERRRIPTLLMVSPLSCGTRRNARGRPPERSITGHGCSASPSRRSALAP